MASMKCLLAVAIVASLACSGKFSLCKKLNFKNIYLKKKIIFFSSAFAIHCYNCQSVSDKKCGTEFEADESMKIDCSKADKPTQIVSWITGTNLNATGCLKQTIDTSKHF